MGENNDRMARRRDPATAARQALTAAVAGDRGAGVVIAGDIGEGKTHLVQRLASDLTGPTSHRIAVLQPRTGRRRELVGLIATARAVAEGRHTPVLVADDLELWDPALLIAVARAVDGFGLRLLGAVRAPHLTRVLGMLRPAATLAVVGLAPWRPTELAGYAQSTLGGRLHPLSLRALLDFSGGNQQCLVELLDEGLRSGRLRTSHGVWVWDGPIEVGSVTSARFWSELAGHGGDVVDLVTTLALAGPLDLEDVLGVHDQRTVEAAERAGALMITLDDGTPRVLLRQPLLGRVALAASSRVRRHQLAGRLRDHQMITVPHPPVVDREPAEAAVIAWGDLLSGDLGAVADAAARLRAPAATADDQALSYGLGSLLAGILALLGLRPPAAVDLLADSVVAFQQAGDDARAGIAQECLGVADVLAGRQEAEAADRRSDDWADLIHAEMITIRGERLKAYDQAVRIADRAAADDHRLLELLARYLKIRICPERCELDRMIMITGPSADVLPSMIVDHARALVDGDVDALERVAHRFDALGLRYLAADTAATAVAAATTDRGSVSVGRSRQLLHRISRQPELEPPEWWRRVGGQVVPLTRREQQIVEAVMRGRTSAEVAAEFCLSRRTVENHLQHAYAKLGVGRRSELSRVYRPTAVAT